MKKQLDKMKNSARSNRPVVSDTLQLPASTLPAVRSTAEALKKTRHAILEVVRWHFNFPHARTLSASMRGREWGDEVAKILGPQLRRKARAALAGDQPIDRAHVEFLSAIHSCCFGTKLPVESADMSNAEFVRGFIIGALRAWGERTQKSNLG